MEEEEVGWPVFEISERARQMIKDAAKTVKLFDDPYAFSSLLDILEYEMLFEEDGSRGFYANRAILQKGLSERYLYGLQIKYDVAVKLYEEEFFFARHFFEVNTQSVLRKTLPEAKNQYKPIDNVFSAVHNISESANIATFIRDYQFLPFLCYVDETNFGSIEIIWTHRSFRRLGLAKHFLDFRFADVSEEETPNNRLVLEWIEKLNSARVDNNQTTIPERLIPVIRKDATLARVEGNANTTRYAHTLFQEITTFMKETKEPIYGYTEPSEVAEVFWRGLSAGRVYLITTSTYDFQQGAQEWFEKNSCMVYSKNRVFTVYFPFLCILGSDGGFAFLWSNQWIASLELEKLVESKRNSKYIKNALEKPFWRKMGFSTAVPSKEVQELEYAVIERGKVWSALMRKKDPRIMFEREFSKERCERLALEINEKLGSKYACKSFLGGDGIDFYKFPDRKEESMKFVKIKDQYNPREAKTVQLQFCWEYASWKEEERKAIIESFMSFFVYELVEE